MVEETEYNEYLFSKIQQLFSKKEAEAFIETCETKRPVTIRVNTNRISRNELIRRLRKRKIEAEGIDWAEEGVVVYKCDLPLGATPEYLGGLYSIQGANSMLPVLNLDVQENQKIFDLCAAPGGKCTHISTLMNGTGVLYANDVVKDRGLSIVSNVHRLWLKNVIVTNMDALEFDLGKADRILLDTPCSGTGVISRYKNIKTSKTSKEIEEFAVLQKKLIQHAFDMLKDNGILVYSTCSILVEENEEVVNDLLRNNKNAKMVDLSVDVGRPGFTSFRGKGYHMGLQKSRRIYPHVQNMDGFFYCKIRKQN